MARISGINIPLNKRVEIGLTYIYGIGRGSSNEILAQLGMPAAREDGEWVDAILELMTVPAQYCGDLKTKAVLKPLLKIREGKLSNSSLRPWWIRCKG